MVTSDLVVDQQSSNKKVLDVNEEEEEEDWGEDGEDGEDYDDGEWDDEYDEDDVEDLDENANLINDGDALLEDVLAGKSNVGSRD